MEEEETNMTDWKEDAKVPAVKRTVMIGQMWKQDFESIRRLFDEQYDEYLGFLRLNDPQRYATEKRERQKVDRVSFEFFLNTGNSFVAEEKHEVIGYVISQTMSDIHGMNDVLLVEEIAVKAKYKDKG